MSNVASGSFKVVPQAPSLARLAALGALALCLMVVDARFRLTEPVRKVVSAVIDPIQWALVQPMRFAEGGADYLQSLEQARTQANEAQRQMANMAMQAHDAVALAEENARLRGLLDLHKRLPVSVNAAQVVYEIPNSYTRRVVIDRGQTSGVVPGSPVMDELGILGQVTSVQPFTSEVTLLTDLDQAIPVLLPRLGVRGVAYGNASNLHVDDLELRFMPTHVDVQPGDILTTSGVDGIYPAGLPVARVTQVSRRAETAFSRIYCAPLARVQGARHVSVLTPLNLTQAQARPELELPEPVTVVPTDRSHRRPTLGHAPRRVEPGAALPNAPKSNSADPQNPAQDKKENEK